MVSVQTSMGTALHSITHLDLVVSPSYFQNTHHQCEFNKCIDKDECTKLSRLFDVSHVPAAVCAMLAVKVPRLQSLSLRGLCVDVALPVFGARCPGIRTLEVEGIWVPLHSLEGIDRWFPSLATFTVKAISTWCMPLCKDTGDGKLDLTHYVSDALDLLHGCSNLTALHLELGFMRWPRSNSLKTDRVDIKCAQWDSCWPSLDEFLCDVDITNVQDLLAVSGFMSRVRSLTLRALPFNSLPTLLLAAPLLEKFVLIGKTPVNLMWQEGIKRTELEGLKARFPTGFQLDCEDVSMLGTCWDMLKSMVRLCPLVNTLRGTFVLRGGVLGSEFLDCLPQHCPALMSLDIKSEPGVPASLQSEEGILASLARLTSLRTLNLDLQIRFTTAGIIRLCESLPGLYKLYLNRSEELCCETAVQEVSHRVCVSCAR